MWICEEQNNICKEILCTPEKFRELKSIPFTLIPNWIKDWCKLQIFREISFRWNNAKLISRIILYIAIQIFCEMIALWFLTKILWTWFHDFFFYFQVVHVLLNECNIIYECKVCFNMFRSLANFISHKRSFCKNKGDNILHVFSNEDGNSGKKFAKKNYVKSELNFTNFLFWFQVVHVLLNECNIIYECKVCFNMFRSLANFISHKRSFCKNKGDNILHVFSNEDGNSGKKFKMSL